MALEIVDDQLDPSVTGARGDAADPLIRTAKRAAASLQRAKISFALAGGLAVYARGGAQTDHDVDFLVQECDVEAALEALREDGFRTTRPPEDWLVKAHDGTVLIDLIFRPVQRPVTSQSLDECEVMPFGGSHLPMLSATTLLVHKALTYGPHHCDLADGLAAARSLREQVDWSVFRSEISESPYAQAFQTLLEKLGIIPTEEDQP